MKKHPGIEKLELLQKGKLRGVELLQILRHLEDCDYCYKNLPPQDPQKVISKILQNNDYNEPDSDNKQINEDILRNN